MEFESIYEDGAAILNLFAAMCALSTWWRSLVNWHASLAHSRERFAALTARESQWRTVYIHILLSGADQSGTHHTRQSSRATLQSARERVFFI
jgi:hypothetical protein